MPKSKEKRRKQNPAQAGPACFAGSPSEDAAFSGIPGLRKQKWFYDNIWSNLLVETGNDARTFLVSDAVPGEGAATVSYSLAAFLGHEYGMKVLFVDTESVCEGDSDTGDQKGGGGFLSYCVDKTPFETLIHQTESENLFYLPSGSGAVSDRRINSFFIEDSFKELVQYTRGQFDITIIGGQPILRSPRMLEIAKLVDAAVLVCRYGYSRRAPTRLAIDKLSRMGVTVAGVILNERRYPVPDWLYRFI